MSTAITFGYTLVRELESADTPLAGVEVITYSPNGRYLATGGHDSLLRLWDAASGQEMLQFEAGGVVTSIAVSSDSSLLVCGTDAGTVYISEDLPGSGFGNTTTLQLEAWINSVALSPSERHIATASSDSESPCHITLWTRDGQRCWQSDDLDIELGRIIFSPDGRFVLGCSWGGSVLIFDAESGQMTANFPTQGSGQWIGWCPVLDDYSLIVTGPGNTVRQLYGIADPSDISQVAIASFRSASGALFDAALFPDGRHFVTVDGEHVWLYHVLRTGAIRLIDSGPRKHDFTAELLTAVAVHPDGQHLAVGVGSDAGSVRIYRLDLAAQAAI